MKASTKKVFEAMLDREAHTAGELRELTGVRNVSAAISEIRNLHGARIDSLKSAGGDTSYLLRSTKWAEVPVSPEMWMHHFAIPKLRRPKVRRPTVEPEEEVHTLLLTDLHFGAKSESVDFEVTRRRLVEATNLAFQHAAHRQSPRGLLEIDVLGDIVHGEGIYPNQAWETAGPMPQQLDLATICIGQVAQAARKLYERVVVNVVPGNHGRTSRVNHDSSNWDYVFGMLLKQHLKDVPRVEVNLPEGGAFWMVRERLGHRFLLVHGHQGSGYQSFRNLVPKWSKNPRIGHFDVAECGHYHKWLLDNAQGIPLLVGGTLQSGGAYGISQYGTPEDLAMTMFGTTRRAPLAWVAPLRVSP